MSGVGKTLGRIPKKQHSDGSMDEVLPKSREGIETLRFIDASFRDFLYRDQVWKPVSIKTIHNQTLADKFRKKKQTIRGRCSADNIYGFKPISDKNVDQLAVAMHGLKAEQGLYNGLGESTEGVYLCRYADLLLKIAQQNNQRTATLLVCKVLLGRNKRVIPNQERPLDPTPNHDSHCTTEEPSSKDSLTTQWAKSLVFLYEYTEEAVPALFPSHCLPHAIVIFANCKYSPHLKVINLLEMEFGAANSVSNSSGNIRRKPPVKVKQNAGNRTVNHSLSDPPRLPQQRRPSSSPKGDKTLSEIWKKPLEHYRNRSLSSENRPVSGTSEVTGPRETLDHSHHGNSVHMQPNRSGGRNDNAKPHGSENTSPTRKLDPQQRGHDNHQKESNKEQHPKVRKRSLSGALTESSPTTSKVHPSASRVVTHNDNQLNRNAVDKMQTNLEKNRRVSSKNNLNEESTSMGKLTQSPKDMDKDQHQEIKNHTSRKHQVVNGSREQDNTLAGKHHHSRKDHPKELNKKDTVTDRTKSSSSNHTSRHDQANKDPGKKDTITDRTKSSSSSDRTSRHDHAQKDPRSRSKDRVQILVNKDKHSGSAAKVDKKSPDPSMQNKENCVHEGDKHTQGKCVLHSRSKSYPPITNNEHSSGEHIKKNRCSDAKDNCRSSCSEKPSGVQSSARHEKHGREGTVHTSSTTSNQSHPDQGHIVAPKVPYSKNSVTSHKVNVSLVHSSGRDKCRKPASVATSGAPSLVTSSSSCGSSNAVSTHLTSSHDPMTSTCALIVNPSITTVATSAAITATSAATANSICSVPATAADLVTASVTTTSSSGNNTAKKSSREEQPHMDNVSKFMQAVRDLKFPVNLVSTVASTSAESIPTTIQLNQSVVSNQLSATPTPLQNTQNSASTQVVDVHTEVVSSSHSKKSKTVPMPIPAKGNDSSVDTVGSEKASVDKPCESFNHSDLNWACLPHESKPIPTPVLQTIEIVISDDEDAATLVASPPTCASANTRSASSTPNNAICYRSSPSTNKLPAAQTAQHSNVTADFPSTALVQCSSVITTPLAAPCIQSSVTAAFSTAPCGPSIVMTTAANSQSNIVARSDISGTNRLNATAVSYTYDPSHFSNESRSHIQVPSFSPESGSHTQVEVPRFFPQSDINSNTLQATPEPNARMVPYREERLDTQIQQVHQPLSFQAPDNHFVQSVLPAIETPHHVQGQSGTSSWSHNENAYPPRTSSVTTALQNLTDMCTVGITYPQNDAYNASSNANILQGNVSSQVAGMNHTCVPHLQQHPSQHPTGTQHNYVVPPQNQPGSWAEGYSSCRYSGERNYPNSYAAHGQRPSSYSESLQNLSQSMAHGSGHQYPHFLGQQNQIMYGGNSNNRPGGHILNQNQALSASAMPANHFMVNHGTSSGTGNCVPINAMSGGNGISSSEQHVGTCQWRNSHENGNAVPLQNHLIEQQRRKIEYINQRIKEALILESCNVSEWMGEIEERIRRWPSDKSHTCTVPMLLQHFIKMKDSDNALFNLYKFLIWLRRHDISYVPMWQRRTSEQVLPDPDERDAINIQPSQDDGSHTRPMHLRTSVADYVEETGPREIRLPSGGTVIVQPLPLDDCETVDQGHAVVHVSAFGTSSREIVPLAPVWEIASCDPTPLPIIKEEPSDSGGQIEQSSRVVENTSQDSTAAVGFNTVDSDSGTAVNIVPSTSDDRNDSYIAVESEMVPATDAARKDANMRNEILESLAEQLSERESSPKLVSGTQIERGQSSNDPHQSIENTASDEELVAAASGREAELVPVTTIGMGDPGIGNGQCSTQNGRPLEGEVIDSDKEPHAVNSCRKDLKASAGSSRKGSVTSTIPDNGDNCDSDATVAYDEDNIPDLIKELNKAVKPETKSEIPSSADISKKNVSPVNYVKESASTPLVTPSTDQASNIHLAPEIESPGGGYSPVCTSMIVQTPKTSERTEGEVVHGVTEDGAVAETHLSLGHQPSHSKADGLQKKGCPDRTKPRRRRSLPSLKKNMKETHFITVNKDGVIELIQSHEEVCPESVDGQGPKAPVLQTKGEEQTSTNEANHALVPDTSQAPLGGLALTENASVANDVVTPGSSAGLLIKRRSPEGLVLCDSWEDMDYLPSPGSKSEMQTGSKSKTGTSIPKESPLLKDSTLSSGAVIKLPSPSPDKQSEIKSPMSKGRDQRSEKKEVGRTARKRSRKRKSPNKQSNCLPNQEYASEHIVIPEKRRRQGKIQKVNIEILRQRADEEAKRRECVVPQDKDTVDHASSMPGPLNATIPKEPQVKSQSKESETVVDSSVGVEVNTEVCTKEESSTNETSSVKLSVAPITNAGASRISAAGGSNSENLLTEQFEIQPHPFVCGLSFEPSADGNLSSEPSADRNLPADKKMDSTSVMLDVSDLVSTVQLDQDMDNRVGDNAVLTSTSDDDYCNISTVYQEQDEVADHCEGSDIDDPTVDMLHDFDFDPEVYSDDNMDMSEEEPGTQIDPFQEYYCNPKYQPRVLIEDIVNSNATTCHFNLEKIDFSTGKQPKTVIKETECLSEVHESSVEESAERQPSPTSVVFGTDSEPEKDIGTQNILSYNPHDSETEKHTAPDCVMDSELDTAGERDCESVNEVPTENLQEGHHVLENLGMDKSGDIIPTSAHNIDGQPTPGGDIEFAPAADVETEIEQQPEPADLNNTNDSESKSVSNQARDHPVKGLAEGQSLPDSMIDSDMNPEVRNESCIEKSPGHLCMNEEAQLAVDGKSISHFICEAGEKDKDLNENTSIQQEKDVIVMNRDGKLTSEFDFSIDLETGEDDLNQDGAAHQINETICLDTSSELNSELDAEKESSNNGGVPGSEHSDEMNKQTGSSREQRFEVEYKNTSQTSLDLSVDPEGVEKHKNKGPNDSSDGNLVKDRNNLSEGAMDSDESYKQIVRARKEPVIRIYHSIPGLDLIDKPGEEEFSNLSSDANRTSSKEPENKAGTPQNTGVNTCDQNWACSSSIEHGCDVDKDSMQLDGDDIYLSKKVSVFNRLGNFSESKSVPLDENAIIVHENSFEDRSVILKKQTNVQTEISDSKDLRQTLNKRREGIQVLVPCEPDIDLFTSENNTETELKLINLREESMEEQNESSRLLVEESMQVEEVCASYTQQSCASDCETTNEDKDLEELQNERWSIVNKLSHLVSNTPKKKYGKKSSDSMKLKTSRSMSQSPNKRSPKKSSPKSVVVPVKPRRSDSSSRSPDKYSKRYSEKSKMKHRSSSSRHHSHHVSKYDRQDDRMRRSLRHAHRYIRGSSQRRDHHVDRRRDYLKKPRDRDEMHHMKKGNSYQKEDSNVRKTRRKGETKPSPPKKRSRFDDDSAVKKSLFTDSDVFKRIIEEKTKGDVTKHALPLFNAYCSSPSADPQRWLEQLKAVNANPGQTQGPVKVGPKMMEEVVSHLSSRKEGLQDGKDTDLHTSVSINLLDALTGEKIETLRKAIASVSSPQHPAASESEMNEQKLAEVKPADIDKSTLITNELYDPAAPTKATPEKDKTSCIPKPGSASVIVHDFTHLFSGDESHRHHEEPPDRNNGTNFCQAKVSERVQDRSPSGAGCVLNKSSRPQPAQGYVHTAHLEGNLWHLSFEELACRIKTVRHTIQTKKDDLELLSNNASSKLDDVEVAIECNMLRDVLRVLNLDVDILTVCQRQVNPHIMCLAHHCLPDQLLMPEEVNQQVSVEGIPLTALHNMDQSHYDKLHQLQTDLASVRMALLHRVGSSRHNEKYEMERELHQQRQMSLKMLCGSGTYSDVKIVKRKLNKIQAFERELLPNFYHSKREMYLTEMKHRLESHLQLLTRCKERGKNASPSVHATTGHQSVPILAEPASLNRSNQSRSSLEQKRSAVQNLPGQHETVDSPPYGSVIPVLTGLRQLPVAHIRPIVGKESPTSGTFQPQMTESTTGSRAVTWNHKAISLNHQETACGSSINSVESRKNVNNTSLMMGKTGLHIPVVLSGKGRDCSSHKPGITSIYNVTNVMTPLENNLREVALIEQKDTLKKKMDNNLEQMKQVPVVCSRTNRVGYKAISKEERVFNRSISEVTIMGKVPSKNPDKCSKLDSGPESLDRMTVEQKRASRGGTNESNSENSPSSVPNNSMFPNPMAKGKLKQSPVATKNEPPVIPKKSECKFDIKNNSSEQSVLKVPVTTQSNPCHTNVMTETSNSDSVVTCDGAGQIKVTFKPGQLMARTSTVTSSDLNVNHVSVCQYGNLDCGKKQNGQPKSPSVPSEMESPQSPKACAPVLKEAEEPVKIPKDLISSRDQLRLVVHKPVKNTNVEEPADIPSMSGLTKVKNETHSITELKANSLDKARVVQWKVKEKNVQKRIEPVSCKPLSYQSLMSNASLPQEGIFDIGLGVDAESPQSPPPEDRGNSMKLELVEASVSGCLSPDQIDNKLSLPLSFEKSTEESPMSPKHETNIVENDPIEIPSDFNRPDHAVDKPRDVETTSGLTRPEQQFDNPVAISNCKIAQDVPNSPGKQQKIKKTVKRLVRIASKKNSKGSSSLIMAPKEASKFNLCKNRSNPGLVRVLNHCEISPKTKEKSVNRGFRTTGKALDVNAEISSSKEGAVKQNRSKSCGNVNKNGQVIHNASSNNELPNKKLEQVVQSGIATSAKSKFGDKATGHAKIERDKLENKHSIDPNLGPCVKVLSISIETAPDGSKMLIEKLANGLERRKISNCKLSNRKLKQFVESGLHLNKSTGTDLKNNSGDKATKQSKVASDKLEKGSSNDTNLLHCVKVVSIDIETSPDGSKMLVEKLENGCERRKPLNQPRVSSGKKTRISTRRCESRTDMHRRDGVMSVHWIKQEPDMAVFENESRSSYKVDLEERMHASRDGHLSTVSNSWHSRSESRRNKEEPPIYIEEDTGFSRDVDLRKETSREPEYLRKHQNRSHSYYGNHGNPNWPLNTAPVDHHSPSRRSYREGNRDYGGYRDYDTRIEPRQNELRHSQEHLNKNVQYLDEERKIHRDKQYRSYHCESRHERFQPR